MNARQKVKKLKKENEFLKKISLQKTQIIQKYKEDLRRAEIEDGSEQGKVKRVR